jgi:hypothetical protein
MCIIPAENLKFESLLCKIFWLPDFKQPLVSSALDYPSTNHRYLSIKLSIIQEENHSSSAVKWEKINERNNMMPFPLRSPGKHRGNKYHSDKCVLL